MILYTVASVVGGGVLGFAYYKLVGCRPIQESLRKTVQAALDERG
jgi:hypothetical protein